MKKIIPLTLLLLTSNCFADDVLHNFDEIKSAAITGKTIHIVVNFANCTAANKALAQPLHIGVFTPDALQVVNDHITTSLLHFTMNNPGFPGKPVYEFIKYTFTDDNNMNLTHQTLDANTYASLSAPVSLNCKLDLGAVVYK